MKTNCTVFIKQTQNPMLHCSSLRWRWTFTGSSIACSLRLRYNRKCNQKAYLCCSQSLASAVPTGRLCWVKCLNQQSARTPCRLPANASGRRNTLKREHNWVSVKWLGCCHCCLPCCCSLCQRKCQSSRQLPAMKYEGRVRMWQYNKPLGLFWLPCNSDMQSWERGRRQNTSQGFNEQNELNEQLCLGIWQ